MQLIHQLFLSFPHQWIDLINRLEYSETGSVFLLVSFYRIHLFLFKKVVVSNEKYNNWGLNGWERLIGIPVSVVQITIEEENTT